ncbi:hypothetical protein V6Z11_D12G117100 [Gossypium hirsutum]|uniref:aspartyl aminopeptidase n=1 Tax=Gossypium hirsutum TaxID=3635 RepID=A0ABM3B6A5_GOSHI|nr:uncharacterized protein LOC107945595 isoform X1 [Gossypium hirsutum]
MATKSRAQLLHHPSAYFSRLPHSHSSFSINFRRRKFSVTPPLLCSSSSSPSASTNPSIVGDLLNYLNESWTQFHATAEAKRQLIAAGFHLLNENDEWDLRPGGRYFFTRNMSCLVAFAVGENFAGTLLVMAFMLLLHIQTVLVSNLWRWFMTHLVRQRPKCCWKSHC